MRLSIPVLALALAWTAPVSSMVAPPSPTCFSASKASTMKKWTMYRS